MKTKPVVVIGSGFGGLGAAARIRAMGWPVVVVEARDQPGGRAGVIKKGPFQFDAGPTVITAPYLLEELWALFGRRMSDRVDMIPVDPFYRIEYHDGARFDYVGDEERLLNNIRELSPADVDGYGRLVRQIKQIFDVGYTELADVPFDKMQDMLRVVPDMVRLGSYRSVYSLVSKYIKDERLRQAFTFQPLLIGGNPFRCSSIYTLIHWLERKWGVYYARGGTHEIIKGLVELLEQQDVQVRLNSPVEEIEVEHGKATAVRLAGGERIEASFVVSNADPSFVYSRLIDAKHRKKHSDRKVASKHPSMSLFVGYFGATKKFPDLAHHTIILGPRYKGLLTDIFDKKVLADDFSLYLHAPTRSDPNMAPPGHEAFYVLSPVPNLRGDVNWEREGEAYMQKILQEVERRVAPGLCDVVCHESYVTPHFFETELRSVDGAAFGLEPRLTQSAWFRYHNRSEDVDDLYFVGASTHPGAGVPGVLSTAKVLERVIPRPASADLLPIVARTAA